MKEVDQGDEGRATNNKGGVAEASSDLEEEIRRYFEID